MRIRRRVWNLAVLAFGVAGVAAGAFAPGVSSGDRRGRGGEEVSRGDRSGHGGTPTTKPGAPQRLNYSRDILPILSDKCFKCHGPDAGSRMADMRLDTSEGAFADRQGRFPIVPGHPEHSLVVKRITAHAMPPAGSGKSLSQTEIAIITRWISEGAVYGKLWSFESLPPSVPVPQVKSAWPHDDIDRFVLAKLNRAGLKPSPPASKLRWLRRVTYDLTGLPPTEREIAAFQADTGPNAFDKVAHRLLASTRFGERAAVDWLDAARYSDSYGYQSDLISPTWPYRDWVIKAFNQNLPYNEFLTDQIAGDLLKSPTRDQRLATAFNRLHRQSNEGGSIALEYKTEYAADRLATYGTSMLGLTLNCARCHDHKFDPITQKEYYQLFGYFNSIDEYGLLLSTEIVPTPSMLLPTPDQDKKLTDLRAKSAAAFEAYRDLAGNRGARTGGLTWQAQGDAAGSEDVTRRTQRDVLAPAGASSQTVSSLNDRFEAWLASKPTTIEIPDVLAFISFDKFADGKFANDAGGSAFAGKLGDVTLVDGPQGHGSSGPRGPQTISGQSVHSPGRAVLLDGDNGIVIRGLPAKERWDPFTWSFWIQDPRASTGPIVLLHRTGGTDVGFCGFDLTLDNGYLTARVMRTWPGNALAIRSKQPVPKNRWSQVAWAYDGSGRASGLALYLDGEPLPSTVLNDKLWKTINAYGDLGPSGGDWSFGQRFRDSGFKGGKLAEVRYVARSLSPLEVEELYDGSSLDQALSHPQAHRKELREYYVDAVDDQSRAAALAMRQAQKELAKFEDGIYEVEVMEEAKPEIPSYFLARGNYDAPRNAQTRVYRNVPKVLPALYLPKQRTTHPSNDRLALAEWTVRRDNPLTARVAVNRFWQMLFGTGLVESSENFGVQGSRPTHPELLDYLALKFMNEGWNVKALLREIVLSSTYRQDSASTPKLNKTDPNNKLLARGPSFRLSAEMLRDTVLAASGLLVEKAGGPPVNPYQPAGLWTENNTMTPGFVQGKGPDLYRRSIYSTWKRTTPVPSMLQFDATSREACSMRRPTTNTPMQALVLLNDVQFVEAARVLATQALVRRPELTTEARRSAQNPSEESGTTRDSDSSSASLCAHLRLTGGPLLTAEGRRNARKDAAEGIKMMVRRLAGQNPDARELAILLQTYMEQQAMYIKDPADADKLIHMGDSKPPASVNPIDLAAMTIVAQTVMNSDLVVWRR